MWGKKERKTKRNYKSGEEEYGKKLEGKLIEEGKKRVKEEWRGRGMKKGREN